MDKNTKIALGLAVVGVGAYLIYKQTQKPVTTANYSGVVGNRQRLMSGMRNIVDNQTDVARPSTFNANGTVGQGKGSEFFNVNDSGWLRANGGFKKNSKRINSDEVPMPVPMPRGTSMPRGICSDGSPIRSCKSRTQMWDCSTKKCVELRGGGYGGSVYGSGF
jgi:hypothetical protein